VSEPVAIKARTAEEIRNWIVARLSAVQGIEPEEVRTNAPLIGMGLDSMQFVVLVGELEEWLGCRFTDNPLFDYPTIDTLAAYLAEQVADGKRLIDPTKR
jgi:acyl carrier protein